MAVRLYNRAQGTIPCRGVGWGGFDIGASPASSQRVSQLDAEHP